MPGLDPGTRCTSVSDYLSTTYSGPDGRIMSGQDDAGKAASVSMSTPAGIIYLRLSAFICRSKFLALARRPIKPIYIQRFVRFIDSVRGGHE
jgi:hypothetical protein